jgi:DNA polymerase zeta
VFYAFDGGESPSHDRGYTYKVGKVVVENPQVSFGRLRENGADIVANELDLLNKVVDLVIYLDPDILVGWEIQSASWGYLGARFHSFGPSLLYLF